MAHELSDGGGMKSWSPSLEFAALVDKVQGVR